MLNRNVDIRYLRKEKKRMKPYRMPTSLSGYNKETIAALQETEKMLQDPNHKTFQTFDELVADIHA